MSFEVSFIRKKEVKSEKNLLKLAEKLELPIKNSCGGDGKCGKCRVKIISGNVSEPTKAELKHLSKEEIEQGYRLACEVTVAESCEIEIP